MRNPTKAEALRIWELLDEGYSVGQIVKKMIDAQYNENWAWATVDKLFDDAFATALGAPF